MQWLQINIYLDDNLRLRTRHVTTQHQHGLCRIVLSPPLSLFRRLLFWWNVDTEDERGEWTGDYTELPVLDNFTYKDEGKILHCVNIFTNRSNFRRRLILSWMAASLLLMATRRSEERGSWGLRSVMCSVINKNCDTKNYIFTEQ